MPESIPKLWRQAVITALKTCEDRKIEWTLPALRRWTADTFGAWKSESYDLMIEALSNDDLEGNETTALPGQLAAYEFLFFRGNTKMYAKIALRNDKVRILILSAHRAERPTLS